MSLNGIDENAYNNDAYIQGIDENADDNSALG